LLISGALQTSENISVSQGTSMRVEETQVDTTSNSFRYVLTHKSGNIKNNIQNFVLLIKARY